MESDARALELEAVGPCFMKQTSPPETLTKPCFRKMNYKQSALINLRKGQQTFRPATSTLSTPPPPLDFSCFPAGEHRLQRLFFLANNSMRKLFFSKRFARTCSFFMAHVVFSYFSIFFPLSALKSKRPKDCAAKLLTAIDPILWEPSCMATLGRQ